MVPALGISAAHLNTEHQRKCSLYSNSRFLAFIYLILLVQFVKSKCSVAVPDSISQTEYVVDILHEYF